MTLAATIFGLTVAEWAVIAGAGVFAIDRAMERMGLSTSSETLKRLREENQDLMRINHQLETEVKKLSNEVAALQARVTDLQKHDMEAVLLSLSKHETQAAERHNLTLGVLREIRDRLPSG